MVYTSKILKADQRKIVLNGDYAIHVSEAAEGIAVNDIFLQKNATLGLKPTAYDMNVIFPLVGTVLLLHNDRELKIAPGELYCYPRSSSADVVVKNPFPDDTLNFLQIGYTPLSLVNEPFVSTVGLNSKNRLFRAAGPAGNLSVGVYDSRTKDKYELSGHNAAVFSYIINGSFELEERLLEYRDGLFQWQLGGLDFESLSEAAIVLIIECSSKN